MRIPVIRGVIERRMLVNYRVDAQTLAGLLPAPFRPKLVHGYGMAGICLIRLRGIRPRWLPAWLGINSENAAHRVAVLWDDNGVVREGVYIRRRDSNSRLNALVGGRLFPGIHHHACFIVNESNDRFDVTLCSDDDETRVIVSARLADRLPATSIFASLEEASEYFRGGSLGYSATRKPTTFQGMELACRDWKVEPLAVEAVQSSFFDDVSLFPPGSIQFDCALLMRNVVHEWHGHADLCCAESATAHA